MKKEDIRHKALAIHDAALDAIYRIEAVSGLMQAASEGRDSRLDPREIEGATGIICEETTKVRDALSSMRKLLDSAKANRVRDRSYASQ